MRSLHQNQQKILEYLLTKSDGATIEDLCDVLGITKTAVKEHIIKMESFGYITFQDTKGSVGRPKRRYFLSSEGHDAFPKQYSWLSQILLELLAEKMGEASVTQILKDLAKRVASSFEGRLSQTATSAEMLAELTKILNELGYRTSLRQSDLRKGAVIEATNCVYHNVAKAHPVLCSFDIQLIKNATGMKDVKLESCIARGGTVCRFCIKKGS